MGRRKAEPVTPTLSLEDAEGLRIYFGRDLDPTRSVSTWEATISAEVSRDNRWSRPSTGDGLSSRNPRTVLGGAASDVEDDLIDRIDAAKVIDKIKTRLDKLSPEQVATIEQVHQAESLPLYWRDRCASLGRFVVVISALPYFRQWANGRGHSPRDANLLAELATSKDSSIVELRRALVAMAAQRWHEACAAFSEAKS